MAQADSDVKRFSQKVANWIDCHPRTGWYVAIWALLVTLDAALDLYARISHLFG